MSFGDIGESYCVISGLSIDPLSVCLIAALSETGWKDAAFCPVALVKGAVRKSPEVRRCISAALWERENAARTHAASKRAQRLQPRINKDITMSIGVPIKVLHEAEGHIVTCETNTGEVYRGKLVEAEDNMNCQMSNITVTYRDGRVSQLEQVYIRGSKIRFLILPDMLKNAPMLKSMKNKNQGAGAGRGKAAILKAQVAARGRGRGGPGARGNIFQKRR
ncbi:hypothetical protein MHYP_G00209040 [Metynnis hypsauchen]